MTEKKEPQKAKEVEGGKICRLEEIFSSSSDLIMNVDFPIDFSAQDKKTELDLAQFFPELDLTFYPPLNRIINNETWKIINEAGLDKDDIETFRIAHDGSHSFLEITGIGVQRILLEDFQVQNFVEAMSIVSKSMTEESVDSLKRIKENIQKLKKIEEMLHSRSIELNEAFAGLWSFLAAPKEKKEVFKRVIEGYLQELDQKALKHGKQGRYLQLWKELLWILKNFGPATVIDSVKYALNIPIITSFYLLEFDTFFANINPRARFDFTRRSLEKDRIEGKKKIAEKAIESTAIIMDEVSKVWEVKKAKFLLELLLGEEKISLIGPWYFTAHNLKKELKIDLFFSRIPIRRSSLIIREAPLAYWRESLKEETKRKFRHWMEGDLMLDIREDVGYTRHISNGIYTTFLFSVLKDQAYKGKVVCLNQGFRQCKAVSLGRTEDGRDKFRELKCVGCEAYKLVKHAKKIAEFWSVF